MGFFFLLLHRTPVERRHQSLRRPFQPKTHRPMHTAHSKYVVRCRRFSSAHLFIFPMTHLRFRRYTRAYTFRSPYTKITRRVLIVHYYGRQVFTYGAQAFVSMFRRRGVFFPPFISAVLSSEYLPETPSPRPTHANAISRLSDGGEENRQ